MAFSFFFRDMHVIDLAVKFLLPEIAGRSRPVLWDAGCAMGQEPYTLAMVLAENMGPFAFKNMRFVASDLDDTNTFGEIVTNAVYPKSDLERIPANIFAKYFEATSDPDKFRIVELIRSRVSFQKNDLLTLTPPVNNVSLVICKNVLLHFQQEQRVAVIRMYHSVLLTGGLLAFEQTQKMPVELLPLFEQVAADGQVFRKL